MKPNNTNRKRNVSKLGRNLLSFDVVLAHFSGNLFKFDDVYLEFVGFMAAIIDIVETEGVINDRSGQS